METVIVATDFSESSANAAQYAAKLSGLLGFRTIILYHSYDAAPMAMEIPIPESVDTMAAHERSLLALDALKSQIEPFKATHTTVELVANDLPLLMGIARLVEQKRAGLVVAGVTGKTGMQQFLMGSNTVNLADECPVPLLIVPNGVEFGTMAKAVFACDLSKVDRTTPVDTISKFVSKLGLTLLVLNIERPNARFDADIIPEQFKLHSLLDHLHPEYHYTEHQDVASGITEFVEAQHASLLMTVPKTYGFFESLFHRSVTKKLAHHTRLPLLVLRGK